ncbi:sigma-54-dependent Fis family transcriptional regulator [Alkalihalobacterium alkalinitrilicum]|uniref:sigma-54-dependent Fis family transcriptional regulator n=1 Tax=Alkalihalobacterium alkalinitrilicum TaxID=427920 RepID=UPI0013031E3B|nr:sigma-54-dependent Fis family transcriptional regulator [Alkalihalobacterium alkalinitrilicum]
MPYRVVSQFDDFYNLEKRLKVNWERFHSDGVIPNYQRDIVLTSWERCIRNQIDPVKNNGKIISSIQEKKEQNEYLMNIFLPFLDEIFQNFTHDDMSIVLTDHEGIIIEERASLNTLRKLQSYNFHIGADWSEEVAGTNAIGTSLIEKVPVQIFSSEHFCQKSHPWVCSAAPIIDPVTKQIIGVLNLTGGKNLVKAHDMGLVTNKVQKIQQGIGTHLINSNVFQIYSLLETIKDPVLIFDMSGNILQHNEAARYLFGVNFGEQLSKVLETPINQMDLNNKPKKFVLDDVKKEGGNEWRITIQPYKLGTYLLGGMATFEKIAKDKSAQVSSKGNRTRYGFDHMLTNEPSMLQLIKLAKRAAFSENTVLIGGETGTGKEILAQSIHDYGPRQKKPFVGVNCGAIPRELLASELFGYEGGAFTGAKSQGKKGKFQLADGGSIFLDEIGDLPLDAQVYLLRVLEEHTVIPVGGIEPVPIDVRVIAATHKDLKQEIRKGKFREDLFHRLNVISLTILPLRERRNDISLLIEFFLKEASKGVNCPQVEEEVWRAFHTYSWPGNIRQLKNVIEQAIFHTDDGVITRKDIPQDLQSVIMGLPVPETEASVPGQWKGQWKKKLNRENLIDVIQKTNGNISEVARFYNVSRMTIYRKLKQFGLE